MVRCVCYRRGAVLQHGSVLLARSPFAPEIPGLADVCSLDWGMDQLISSWSEAISRRLELDSDQEELTDQEIDAVNLCIVNRFGRASWTGRR